LTGQLETAAMADLNNLNIAVVENPSVKKGVLQFRFIAGYETDNSRAKFTVSFHSQRALY